MQQTSMQLFIEICTAVTVEKITQESILFTNIHTMFSPLLFSYISCLNTLLVFLLFARRQDKLNNTIKVTLPQNILNLDYINLGLTFVDQYFIYF
jgi:hypothetical protein